MAIGTHLIDRDNSSGALLAEGVARGTVAVENGLPFGSPLLIERKGIGRGLNFHEILLNPLQARTVPPVLNIAINPLLAVPSPSAELDTTSVGLVFKPSQCSDMPW